jgi:hypothetical protein
MVDKSSEKKNYTVQQGLYAFSNCERHNICELAQFLEHFNSCIGTMKRNILKLYYLNLNELKLNAIKILSPQLP